MIAINLVRPKLDINKETIFADYETYKTENYETIKITTVKDIQAGEELFINYNANPIDATPVWFDKKIVK
jgi:SET domain-containing protein